MRGLFPGYYHPDDDFFKKLWSEATFIFDANVLLDLFRYSPDTVSQIFKFLEDNKERIWLPHQAAFEYHNNLLDVISGQKKLYKEAKGSIDSLLGVFSKKREHPFIENDLFEELSEISGKVKEKLDEEEDVLQGLLKSNPTKGKVADLYFGKVGDEYSEKDLKELYDIGKARYEKNIPPGFKDIDKPEQKRYGDFIFWKQILDYANDTAKGIILVTSDNKEDWFVSISGKTIGPRPELIKEFKDNKDIPFYIYQTGLFLEYANKYISSEITKETISEVKEKKKAKLPFDVLLGGQNALQEHLNRQAGLGNSAVEEYFRRHEAAKEILNRQAGLGNSAVEEYFRRHEAAKGILNGQVGLGNSAIEEYLRRQKAAKEILNRQAGWSVTADEDSEEFNEEQDEADEEAN